MGYPPFWDEDQHRLYAQIKAGAYDVSTFILSFQFFLKVNKVSQFLGNTEKRKLDIRMFKLKIYHFLVGFLLKKIEQFVKK